MKTTKYALKCACDAVAWVSPAEAGSTKRCTECKCDIDVPAFSLLKTLPQVDASPLGQILYKISHAAPPFDETCQGCASANAEFLLPVQLEYVPAEEMVSNESYGKIQTHTIPCFFCHGCYRAFQRAMWRGLVQQLVVGVFHSFWLLIAFAVSVIVALILPFISWPFVIAIVWGLLLQLTRRTCNPALMSHLEKICGFRRDVAQNAHLCKLRLMKCERTAQ